MFERGVSVPAWRVARPVLVSGGVCGWAQPHDLRAGGGRRRSCEGHVALTQRNEALLAEISQINLELLRRRALE